MIWRVLCGRHWKEKWHFRPPHSALKGFHQRPLWVRGWFPANGVEKGGDGGEKKEISMGGGAEWWRRRGATWHLREHIKSVNRCDIIIKLAVGSLFSLSACRCRLSVTLTTPPTSFSKAPTWCKFQRILQPRRQTDTSEKEKKKKKRCRFNLFYLATDICIRILLFNSVFFSCASWNYY